MKKYLAIVVGIIILSITLEAAFGQFEGNTYWKTPADYIKYADNRELLVKDLPRFCFYEPEEGKNAFSTDSLFDFSVGLTSHWIGLLENKSNNYNGVWDIEMQRIPAGEKMQYHFDKCDLHMFWVGAPPLNIETGAYYKGGIYRLVGTSTEHKMIMYTYDYFPNGTKQGIPVYEVKATEQEVLESTFLHELGHVFGLGHHKWYDKYDWYGGQYYEKHADRSIMYTITPRTYGNVDGQKLVTDFDINAIIEKYGEDGWGGKTNWKITDYTK